MENGGEINPYEATNTKIPTLSFDKVRIRGGPEEIRTLDLSDANRTLSQLSYRPGYLDKQQLFAAIKRFQTALDK